MEKFTAEEAKSLTQKSLREVLQEGAEKMLQVALEIEIEQFLEKYREERVAGNQRITRNGFHREREIMTEIGSIKVRVPRARDKEKKVPYRSSLIPPYLKRTDELEDFIPFLYLKGISTGDFEEVLSRLLRRDVSFSANTVVRLKERWMKEYQEWTNNDLSDKEYVYWWVDGVHFNVRLEDDRTCILVIMGTRKDGKKELVAIQDGFRESELSWREIMLNLKKRGLKKGPKLAIGDGALGFWLALRKEFSGTREQRCWVHKTANVLDKLPGSVRPQAKRMIHDIYLADTRENAERAFNDFVTLYEDRYPKAVKCLLEHKEETMAFYDFPAQHWRHIRTTNPIESTFATVRLRTHKTKGCGTRDATLMMVFKLVQAAEKRWQRIHRFNLIPFVLKGVQFKNGMPVEEKKDNAA